jgi:hypothetical protein
MGINIKNLAVETRIRELATIRGMNLVAAVAEAVENEIEREREPAQKEAHGEMADEDQPGNWPDDEGQQDLQGTDGRAL